MTSSRELILTVVICGAAERATAIFADTSDNLQRMKRLFAES